MNKKASERLKIDKNESFKLDFTNKQAQSINSTAKVFANLSLEVIKSRETSSDDLKEHIVKTECNLSLNQIIQNHLKYK